MVLGEFCAVLRLGRDARLLLAELPGVRVIGCSAERPAMRVFAANGAVDERVLDVAALIAAIAGVV